MDKELLYKEVRFKATRSSGPGGQNVNKVSSKALLVWDFEKSKLIGLEEKNLLSIKCQSLINAQGMIQLSCDQFRDLPHNKEEAFNKLLAALKKAFFKPKKRRPTKVPFSAQKKRLESKKKHGEIKKNRQSKDWS